MKVSARKKSLGLCIPFFLISLFAVAGLWGCNSPTSFDGLKIDRTDLVAASGGDTLKVIVSSNSPWVATASHDWLKPNAKRGVANGTIRITVNVDPNFGNADRNGSVEFKTETEQVTLKVTQKHGDVDISKQQYDLKVIFHVLYNEETEKRLQSQNNPRDEYPDYYPINSSQLQEILDKVNDIYKGWPEEPPAYGRDDRYYQDGQRPFPTPNLRFSLATEDPDGNQLTPAGIKRYEITEKELSVEEVMGDKKGGKYQKMSFPISKYINVYIFPFRSDGAPGTMTLGVAHMPQGTKAHPIEGLATLNRRVPGFDNYNHCVVINSKIFEPRQQVSLPQRADTPYKTIAHELGHYVGLMHVFAEEVQGNKRVRAESCIDSDYVSDTYSYNRVSFERDNIATLGERIDAGNLSNATILRTLRSRFDCERSKNYLATNVMDYDWTYGDRFSEGQVNRLRQVLFYSFTVPGFKVDEPETTRSGGGISVEPRFATCKTTRIFPIDRRAVSPQAFCALPFSSFSTPGLLSEGLPNHCDSLVRVPYKL